MFTASLITAVIALIVAGPVLWSGGKTERAIACCCFACTLPMCWLMFHGVRMPLDRWLLSMIGDGELLSWIRTTYAPLTEEPAKLWPLCIPAIRKFIKQGNTGRIAIALGVGFAMGEIFTVADLITAKSPQIASLPWYSLGGFINERLMTCVIHSGMTGMAILVYYKRNSILLGLSAAMALHYIANFPITMAHRGWFGSSEIVVQLILVLWVAACAVAACAFLMRLFGIRHPGVCVYGEAECPSCHTRYSRSLMRGANFGFSLRYEPCPNCKHWHWTRRIDDG